MTDSNTSSPDPPRALRPVFFISRGGGKLTHMIPADELPDTVSFKNFSKTMEFKDTAGMTSIGEMPHTGRMYDVDVKGTPSIIVTANNDSTWRNPIPPPRVDMTNLQLVPFSHNISNDRYAPDRKLYCSYWLRHGECDYLQQGCKYLHVMPQDIETLNRCGLRDVPRWYRNQQAVIARDQGTVQTVAGNSLLDSGLAGSLSAALPVPMSPPKTPSKATRFPADQVPNERPLPSNYLGAFGNSSEAARGFEANLNINYGPWNPLSAAATPFSPVLNGTGLSAPLPRYDPFADPTDASRRVPIRMPEELNFLGRMSNMTLGESKESVSPIGSRPSARNLINFARRSSEDKEKKRV